MTITSKSVCPYPCLRNLYTRGTDFITHADVGHILGGRIIEPVNSGVDIPDEFHQRMVANGCQLVYQTSEFADGTPLTMKELHARRENSDALSGKMLFPGLWYEDEPFYIVHTPRPGYYFKTRTNIQDTNYRRCVWGLQTLATFVETLFGDKLSRAGTEAIEELRDKASAIETLCTGENWEEGARQFVALKASQLFLPSPIEVLCHCLLSQKVIRERLFSFECAQTNVLSAINGDFVDVGRAGAEGAHIYDWRPNVPRDGLGFAFSGSAELYAG